jgi:hypothetical protein
MSLRFVRRAVLTLLFLSASVAWLDVSACPAYAAVAYPPPSAWKGVNYSPERHSYFRMLYDWYSYDSTAGMYVYQMADNDMATLSQNGVNFLRLYLWDRDLLKSVNSSEWAGFCSDPLDVTVCKTGGGTDPSQTPGSNGSQWTALNDFVQRAENHGLYVGLFFAYGRMANELKADNMTVSAIMSNYTTWVSKFVTYLTPVHKNVLMWGLNWNFQPDNYYPQTNAVWPLAYQALDAVSRANSPHPGVLGLIGVGTEFYLLTGPGGSTATDIIDRGSGYVWNWQFTQQLTYTMHQLLTATYGTAKDPDIYEPGLYTPNGRDIGTALVSLTTGTGVQNGMQIPAVKIDVGEFATSSSVGGSPPQGNNVQTASLQDSLTPTTTVPGQSQWLSNALCGYTSAGLSKFAYWALYDPYTLWSSAPWSYTGQNLAWNAFWGLAYENDSNNTFESKPSWSTLTSYYLHNSLSCAYAPAVSLTADNTFYTTNQPVPLTWTAAETASLSLSQPSTNGVSYSCLTGKAITLAPSTPPGSLVGDCAYTNTVFPTTGTPTITMTATNGSQHQNASTTITIGYPSVINAITASDYTYNIHTNSTIVVWGNGYSKTGGNTIQLTRSGYGDVWLYETDGYYYWDQSYYQINASLNGRAAAGTWTAYVRTPYTGPSAGYTLNIQP